MIEYILGGKTIRVPEDKVDDFLSEYPDAKIKESIGFDLLDPNFQEDTVESADAVSEKTPAQEDMVSVSEDTSLELQEYNEETRLKKDELDLISSDVNELSFEPVKVTKFIPGSVGRTGGNPYVSITEQPYEEELNQAKLNLKNEKEVTEEDVFNEARFIISENKKHDLRVQKNKDYLKNLTDKERVSLGFETSKLKNKEEREIENEGIAIDFFSKQYEKSAELKNLKNLKKSFEDPSFEFDLSYAIENNEKIVELQDGRKAPLAAVEAYESLIIKNNENVDFIKKSVNNYINKIEKQRDLITDLDFLKRNYSKMDKLAAIANQSVFESAAGIYGSFIDFTDLISTDSTNKKAPQKKILNEVLKKSREYLKEEYSHSVDYENAFDSFSNFGEFTSESLSGQTGTLMMLSTGQVAGLTGLGLSSYGRTISDIEILDEEQETSTSNLEKRLTALGYSSFEVTLGSIPTIKLLGKTAGRISASKSRDLYKGFADYARKNYKGIPEAFVTEYVSEGATQFAQNGIDVIRGTKNTNQIFEGVDEAAMTGGMLGVAISSTPVIKGAVLASFSDYKKYEEFRNNASKIAELNKQVSGLDKRTKEYKTITGVIKDLTTANSDILNEIENNIETELSPDGYNLFKNATEQQENIRTEIDKISKRKDLKNSTKQARISILKQRFDQLAANRNVFKKDFKNIFSIESKDVVDDYTNKAKQELGVGVNIDDINKLAQNMYSMDKIEDRNNKAKKAINTLAKRNIINTYTFEKENKDLLITLKEDIKAGLEDGSINITPKKQKEIIEGFNKGFLNGANIPTTSKDGSIKYKIYVSGENSLKNGRTETAIHEIGHSIFTEALGSEPELFNDLAVSIMGYLKKNNESAFRRISFQTKGQDVDEILTNFLEEVSSGRLDLESKKNKQFTTTIGLSLRNILSKATKSKDLITFKGSSDISDFLTILGKKISKGELKVSDVDIIKKKGLPGVESKSTSTKVEVKKSLSSLQEQLDNLDELDFDFDMFAFEAAKTNLKKKIELAKKKEAEPKKETKEKPKKKVNEKLIGDQFKEMVPEGTTNSEYKSKIVPKVIRKIEDDRMLFPLVKKIAAGYNIVADNVYGKSWDDFYDAVVGVQLKKNILNFKPESNDDLGGYIIGGQAGVRNRVKEALEKFRKEESKATEDIDKAADLTAEEKTSKQEARKKYTSIINSNVVPSFTTKAITEKLTGIINSLKSKITDKAGNNAASTPLIKEIKSKVGKVVGDKTAIPKLIRERMGKFTKDQKTYEQFLIKNKKAILENMTTTWLMTSIPNAVEKSVGGKYTGEFDVINIAGKEAKYEVFKPNYVPYSEWEGAKIDREGGAKRGITSGNELVRRVPASRISDQDFVDALIEKGNNKKTQSKFESLSKALAEELSFEVISRELKNPNSEISLAFENNQQALGVMIKDNIAQEFNRQSERGLVKFSLTSKADTRVADFLSIEGVDSRNANKVARAAGFTKNEYDDFVDKVGVSTINRLKYITDIEISVQEQGIEYLESVDDYEKAYSGIKFSISKQEAYKNRLRNKRPDLSKEQIDASVQSVFDFRENNNAADKKKSKLEKLAFHYMANGFLILPEDGYKVIEAEKISEAKKIDPFSFKNPNELIEKYAGEVKKARTNPDKVKEFTNKEEFKNGVVTYDVQDSKKGQIAVREVVDTNWGEKANPWCLVARSETLEESGFYDKLEQAEEYAESARAKGYSVDVRKTEYGSYSVYSTKIVSEAQQLDQAFKAWKDYNEKGNGFKISFKDGKLLSFRDGNEKKWWNRMDAASDNLVYEVKETGVNGVDEKTKTTYIVDAKTGSTRISEEIIGDEKTGEYTVKEYRTDPPIPEDNLYSDSILLRQYSKRKIINKQLTQTANKDGGFVDLNKFDIIQSASRAERSFGDYSRIKLVNNEKDNITLVNLENITYKQDGATFEDNGIILEGYPKETIQIMTGDLLLDTGQYDRNWNLETKNLGTVTISKLIKKDGSYSSFTIDGVDVLASPTEIDLSRYIRAKESGAIDAGIKFSSRIDNVLGVNPDDSKFSNPENVKRIRETFVDNLKYFAEDVGGLEKAINILLPTISSGWKRKSQNIMFYDYPGGVKEFVGYYDKNNKQRPITTSFIFLGRKDFFDYLREKKVANVEYVNGSREYKLNGETIEIKSTPPQSPYDFSKWDKTKWTLSKRQDYALEQREGAYKFFETIKKQYEKGKISEADLAMILNSFNSSIKGLIRTAAIPSYYYKVKGLDVKKDYRYEHTIPAVQILKEVAKYITQENYTKSLDNIFENYKVAIIPKKHDKVLDSFYRSTMPSGNVFYNENEYAKNDTYVARYDQKDYKAALRKQGLKPIKLAKFSLSQNLKDYNSSVNESIKFAKSRNNQLPSGLRLSGSFSAEAVDKAVNTYQEAINNAIKYSYAQNPKGISVWDFDDTLAKTKSNVLYTMPDGTKGKLDAAEFAAKSEELADQGAQFDFSEFSKVMKGEKGPMFDKAIKRNKKFGNKNVYILTARPADSKYAIHEFLKGIGLDIRLENIVGLADGNPQAKASWMIGKVAEGYNDFYFADDHLGNVKAVKQVLDNFDVKGKVQQAKIKFSKSLDKDFNDMLERNKGVSSTKEFSPVVAKRMAKNKSMFKFWMPASLDDFRGLTQYVFAGKGKQGEADQKFFQDALITPYFRGIKAIEDSRQTFKDDFKALNRAYKPVLKKLGKLIPNGDYTYDQAIRVMLWKKSGYDIPGLSKKDEKNLVDFVESQPDLLEYVLLLQRISKRPKWAKPEAFWDAQTIISDLNNMTEKGGRKEYISEFIENVDIIFSEKNLLKIKALYGEAQVSALKDIIWRMKNGTNRTSGMNKNVNRFNNWVNNSIGAIMFFNRRSALLQTLSTVNFINWSDNNIIKAGAAFANQPQFWKDFAMIFNSAKLKQRRSGLKSDVNEAEIASAVKGSKNKATAALSYLLKKGFLPTQMVDSFAIASGGATFYRNRVNTYLKQGMELAAAEKQAFEDFSQISEETQQSGDPALISSDQASALGRLLLAFQNTPIQLNRSIKKAALDIKNRRRSPGQTMVQSDFSNLSKIIYYGAIQNIIFSALQNALFALIPGFGDDDDELTDEEQKEKYGKVVSTKQGRIINGISDTLLKGGFGVPGAFISTAKNMYMEYDKQEKKKFLADHTYTILAGANLAPPVGSKLRKIYSAIQTNRFEKDVIKKRGWDVTIDGRFNLSPSYRVLGSFTEGATNLPLDRIVSEVDAITEALDSRNTTWQRLALAMGWKTWDVSAKNEEHDLIKTKAKAVRKKEGIEKAKKTRAGKKLTKEERSRISVLFRYLPDSEKRKVRKMSKKDKDNYFYNLIKNK